MSMNQKEKNVDDLKATFIRNVQHELRTPLTIILGYTDLLREGEFGRLAPEQAQVVAVIARQTQTLQTAMDRIRTLLTIETGESPYQALTLAEIVTEVLEEQRARADRAGLTLVAHLPANLPSVFGNLGYLQQALECVIENALKFTRNKGQIEVRAETQANWVCLSVIDTGIGIADDQQAYIFDAFYQVDGSPTRRYSGLGLGLAVAKAVVEAHRGCIEVESQPGQGSRFTIKLPALPAQTLADQLAQEAVKPHHILIVDDEEQVALTLQEGLQTLPNCEILTATNGEQALQLFKQRSFDLLITDYEMPGIDGITLAIQVRRLYPHTATIVITGYGDSLSQEPLKNGSIQHILDKPVKLAEIRSVVLEMLAGLTRTQVNTRNRFDAGASSYLFPNSPVQARNML